MSATQCIVCILVSVIRLSLKYPYSYSECVPYKVFPVDEFIQRVSECQAMFFFCRCIYLTEASGGLKVKTWHFEMSIPVWCLHYRWSELSARL